MIVSHTSDETPREKTYSKYNPKYHKNWLKLTGWNMRSSGKSMRK